MTARLIPFPPNRRAGVVDRHVHALAARTSEERAAYMVAILERERAGFARLGIDAQCSDDALRELIDAISAGLNGRRFGGSAR